MKKNNMLRLASVLLVAVLLSTCAISGVFAKYYRTGADNDAAQVAKWGVKITPVEDATANSTVGLFSNAYASDTDTYTNNTVIASGEWKLVAPGTSDEWNAFDVTGTPEVAVNVSYTADVTLDKWTVDGADYCPVVFKVGAATYGMTGFGADNESATVADLATAVKGAIEAASDDYAANTDLSTVDFPTISWVWAFGETELVKDTALGDAAADGNPATIAISVTATITQID